MGAAANTIVRQVVWKRDAGQCRYCGAPGQEYDHVRPRTHHGQEAINNLVVSCSTCNRIKGAESGFHLTRKRHILYYRRQLVAPGHLFGSELMDQVQYVRRTRQVQSGLAWARERWGIARSYVGYELSEEDKEWMDTPMGPPKADVNPG